MLTSWKISTASDMRVGCYLADWIPASCLSRYTKSLLIQSENRRCSSHFSRNSLRKASWYSYEVPREVASTRGTTACSYRYICTSRL